MSRIDVEYAIKVVDQFDKPMKLFTDDIESANKSFDSLDSSLLKSIKTIGLLKVAGNAVGKAFDFGKESINASNQIEVYEASLKNMLGTSDAARERMQDYMRIAQQTPFDLPQVVEAGNKLQAVGKYSEENLKMLGDLAAVSGKPMEQALNAFTKMASGQKGIAVDMFRDLMITTEDWTKATGKGIDKNGQLEASTKELLAALPQIMKSKGYLGMMATQAETTQGKLANLEDGIFQLKAAIGEQLRPTVLNFTSSASRAVDSIKRWVEIPLEQKIAAEKQELNFLVEQLLDTNTKEDERATVIDKLQQKYPEFLKNLDLEKSTTEDITAALKSANDEYDRKMKNAAINRKIEQLEAEAGETRGDIEAYEASIKGKKRYAELSLELKELTNSIFGKDEIGRYDLDDEGNLYHYYMVGKTSYRDKVEDWEKRVPEDTVKELFRIHDEMVVAKEVMTSFGNDEKRLKKAEKAYEKYKNVIKFWESMLEPDNKPGEDDNNGNSNGGSSSTSQLEDAATTISAGGKSVKNFNITINDGLVKEVTNNFNSSDDDPASATSFMEKLDTALQMILNDANYAAN